MNTKALVFIRRALCSFVILMAKLHGTVHPDFWPVARRLRQQGGQQGVGQVLDDGCDGPLALAAAGLHDPALVE